MLTTTPSRSDFKNNTNNIQKKKTSAKSAKTGNPVLGSVNYTENNLVQVTGTQNKPLQLALWRIYIMFFVLDKGFLNCDHTTMYVAIVGQNKRHWLRSWCSYFSNCVVVCCLGDISTVPDWSLFFPKISSMISSVWSETLWSPNHPCLCIKLINILSYGQVPVTFFAKASFTNAGRKNTFDDDFLCRPFARHDCRSQGQLCVSLGSIIGAQALSS